VLSDKTYLKSIVFCSYLLEVLD